VDVVHLRRPDGAGGQGEGDEQGQQRPLAWCERFRHRVVVGGVVAFFYGRPVKRRENEKKEKKVWSKKWRDEINCSRKKKNQCRKNWVLAKKGSRKFWVQPFFKSFFGVLSEKAAAVGMST
jgi:hypothetical protein